MPFRIRPARPDDASTLAHLINALADYERLADESTPDPEALAQHLAPGAAPRCHALLAEDLVTGDALGFALYFFNYSTFLTRWGIHLEDLYVIPEQRGQGIGYALLKRVAELAVERDCERLEWAVLDWNELAIDFYRKLGAEALDEWTTMRLRGDALQRLGRPARPAQPDGPHLA